MKSSIFLTICLVLISQCALPTLAGNLAAEICQQTQHDRANCMNVLRDPKIQHAKNYVQLSKYVLELALKKGMEGQLFLKGLALANPNPAIVQCANFDYDGVVSSFRSALAEIKEDPQTASYDAKVAGDGPDTCERGLTNSHIVNPAISALNKDILLLSQIAFLVTNNL